MKIISKILGNINTKKIVKEWQQKEKWIKGGGRRGKNNWDKWETNEEEIENGRQGKRRE